MDSSARNGMKLSLVEVPNVVSVLSWAKKVLLAHILANKTEKKKKKVVQKNTSTYNSYYFYFYQDETFYF